jgi:hypothetical protein
MSFAMSLGNASLAVNSFHGMWATSRLTYRTEDRDGLGGHAAAGRRANVHAAGRLAPAPPREGRGCGGCGRATTPP